MCWLHTPRCGPSMKVQPGATPFKTPSLFPQEPSTLNGPSVRVGTLQPSFPFQGVDWPDLRQPLQLTTAAVSPWCGGPVRS